VANFFLDQSIGIDEANVSKPEKVTRWTEICVE